ncbi:hypothetical protein VTO73DRAFT_8976 [Trametes versicolor]
MAALRPDVPPETTPKDLYQQHGQIYAQEQKAQAWSEAAGMVKQYSDEMVDKWNKEIDTYLVYAGLFSAIVTGFNAQSYLLLQPSVPDPTLAILQRISSHLVDPTQSLNFRRRDDADSTPPVPAWAVWLNALWFSSLILSLTSASIGIMVKQWLNEYKIGLPGTSRQVARARQYRLDNLKRWHVEGIVVLMPVLLQLALACFFAGLLVLLWHLHHTVAGVASSLIGLLGVFILSTTLLPLFDSTCAYVSPHIRVLYSIWRPKQLIHWMCSTFTSTATSDLTTLHPRRWYAQWLPTCISTAITRFEAFICRHIACIVQDTWQTPKPTWQGRERSAIDRQGRYLDTQILVDAYYSTLHPDALSTATVCLMDSSDRDVLGYFQRLYGSVREHFGVGADAKDGPLGWGNQCQLLWLHILLCVLLQDESPLTAEESSALGTYIDNGFWADGMQVAEVEWALCTLSSLIDHSADGRLSFLDEERLLSERDYLLSLVGSRGITLGTALLHAVSQAYRRVRVSASVISEMSAYDSPAVHSTYLRHVHGFLGWADRAFTSPGSIVPENMQAVVDYTQDVLHELTRTLNDLFARPDQRTNIDTNSLWDVVYRLCRLSPGLVERCVPNELVLDVLRMADTLSVASGYGLGWQVEIIQARAREFEELVVRVKGESEQKTPLQISPVVQGTPVVTTPGG